MRESAHKGVKSVLRQKLIMNKRVMWSGGEITTAVARMTAAPASPTSEPLNSGFSVRNFALPASRSILSTSHSHCIVCSLEFDGGISGRAFRLNIPGLILQVIVSVGWLPSCNVKHSPTSYMSRHTSRCRCRHSLFQIGFHPCEYSVIANP